MTPTSHDSGGVLCSTAALLAARPEMASGPGPATVPPHPGTGWAVPSPVMRPSIHRSATFVALLAALLAACSVHVAANSGPSTSAGGGTTPGTSASSPTTSGTKSISWTSCDSSFQCASLDVPLDYDKPDGQLTLALVQASTRTREAHRLAAGQPGRSRRLRHRPRRGEPVPAEHPQRFDIVGFDPRGVGRSSPLDCHRHLQEMYDADPTPADQAGDVAPARQESRTFVRVRHGK